MVNAKSTEPAPGPAAGPDEERRERARVASPEPAQIGLANPNPFGDLHTIQHLTARLARAVKVPVEALVRAECRTWAEPLAVQRLVDYKAERGDGLAAWLALPCGHDAPAQVVFDAALLLEVIDLFFGGSGHTAAPVPKELSPAALAMVGRFGGLLVPALAAAWEPVTPLAFAAGPIEANPTALRGCEAEDAIVVTRLGFARSEDKPRFIDIIYPVAALKPHHESITRKVHARTPDVAPAWRQNLTRAVMSVRLPVRTVLAEPVLPLARLLELKVGDVIPIGLGDQIPIMVGTDRLGIGTVGTANGRAAIQLNAFALLEGTDQ